MVVCRQLTRLEQKMSADIYMILDVLGQHQQRQQPTVVRPRVNDVGVNTVLYYDTTSGTLLDNVHQ